MRRNVLFTGLMLELLLLVPPAFALSLSAFDSGQYTNFAFHSTATKTISLE